MISVLVVLVPSTAARATTQAHCLKSYVDAVTDADGEADTVISGSYQIGEVSRNAVRDGVTRQSTSIPAVSREDYSALSPKQRAEYWKLDKLREKAPADRIPGVRLSPARAKKFRQEIALLSSGSMDVIAKRAERLLRAEAPLTLLGDGGLAYVFHTRLQGREVIVKVPKYTYLLGYGERSIEVVLSSARTMAKRQVLVSEAIERHGISVTRNSFIPHGAAGELGMMVTDFLPIPEPLRKVRYQGLSRTGEIVEKTKIATFQDYVQYLEFTGRKDEAKSLLRKFDDLEDEIHQGYDDLILDAQEGKSISLQSPSIADSPWKDLWKISNDLGTALWSPVTHEDSLPILASRVITDGPLKTREAPIVDIGRQAVNELPLERKGVSKANCNSTFVGTSLRVLRIFDFGICIEWVLADP